jgi:RNA polymerase subunit RPABC4/transcription elongation factor Spt4
MSDIQEKGADEIYCPSCRAIIKKEAELCPKCGVPKAKWRNGQEVFCSSCGEKIKGEAEICPKCGVRQKQPSGTFMPTFESFDKWAWTLACTPLMLSLITAFLNTFINLGTVAIFVIALIINSVFFILDMQELKKSGHDVDAWMWLGFLLIPVYLFIRASKTSKKYGYAIAWCVIFVVSLIFDAI